MYGSDSSSSKCLGIVIPLKSKKNANDWAQVSESLARTVKSVVGQKCNLWRCAIVGHEAPGCELDLSANVSFHNVNDLEAICFDGWDPKERQQAITTDKNTKLYQAVMHLQGKGITHWFALDADDLLRDDFVEHALSLNSSVGGVIRNGYILDFRTNTLVPKRNIFEACGSTSVLTENSMSPKTDGMMGVPWTRYSHLKMPTYYSKELGKTCSWIDEPVVCYVTQHGENASVDYKSTLIGRIKRTLKTSLRGRKFVGKRKASFSQ